ncbi:MAG: hypothetical protein PHD04_01435, partial [Candidatus Pacebacteria bacterium]|nr:hypothetical protein [Candidatus Paceibacterota bacterium]
AGAATMPQVGGKIVVPAELASAKTTSAPAVALPGKLEGDWTIEPWKYYGNKWSIQKSGDQWVLTWWKVKDTGCSVENAPLTVKNDVTGAIEISLSNYECIKEFSAKLEKNGSGFNVAGYMATFRGSSKFSGTLK